MSTIRRVLLLVDAADVLGAVLHAWLATFAGPPAVPQAFRAVAVDGKTCRCAVGSDGARVHLFSIVEHTTGVPLGQVRVPFERLSRSPRSRRDWSRSIWPAWW